MILHCIFTLFSVVLKSYYRIFIRLWHVIVHENSCCKLILWDTRPLWRPALELNGLPCGNRVYFTLLLCRSNKEWSETENKGKTWSRGTNLRLPFVVSVNLNISTDVSVRLHRNVLSLRRGSAYSFNFTAKRVALWSFRDIAILWSLRFPMRVRISVTFERWCNKYWCISRDREAKGRRKIPSRRCDWTWRQWIISLTSCETNIFTGEEGYRRLSDESHTSNDVHYSLVRESTLSPAPSATM